jgi:hypothetical protein
VSAVTAIASLGTVFAVSTVGTNVSFATFILFYHGGRYDAGGHGYYSVTQQHNSSRQKLPDGSGRGDIAIAYGTHRHNTPVDSIGDIGEWSAGLLAFNHVHKGTYADVEYQHKAEEDKYLGKTALQGEEQQVSLLQKVEELKDTKNAYQTEGADDEEETCTGEYESEIEGQNGEEVYNAKETQYITLGLGRTVDANDILQRKEDIEGILQYYQSLVCQFFNTAIMGMHQVGYREYGIVYGTLEYGDEHTQDNAHYQCHIEGLSPKGIGTEDDGIELLF